MYNKNNFILFRFIYQLYFYPVYGFKNHFLRLIIYRLFIRLMNSFEKRLFYNNNSIYPFKNNY